MTASNGTPPAATSSLTEALVAFQADLPVVTKNKTNPAFKSKYADLAEVSKAAFPRLAQFGLAFTAFPTLNEDGEMVLAYTLRHGPSGETERGEYRLPQGKPQEIGSAITYGRRQCLCAVTGIVADDDDDANAAQSATTEAAPRGRTAQRQSAKPAQKPADTSATGVAQAELLGAVRELSLDWIAVRKAFARQYGAPVANYDNPEHIRAFTTALKADPTHVLGVTQPTEETPDA